VLWAEKCGGSPTRMINFDNKHLGEQVLRLLVEPTLFAPRNTNKGMDVLLAN